MDNGYIATDDSWIEIGLNASRQSKPTFFGANPWPWVDPTTGNLSTLPAKARFDAGTPNTVP